MAEIMRAIRVSHFGGPDVLKMEKNRPIPKNLKEHEVLIKVYAAGVNPLDTYICSGSGKPDLPFTPGRDCAGLVENIGTKVTKFTKNDRVFTAFKSITGTYAEYSICHENLVFPLSNKLTFSQGAALGIPYFTAYRALVTSGKSKPREKVLVHGASGGVGIAAVQLAKEFGLTVIGTAGTPAGMEVVKKAGANYVYNHHSEDYVRDILKVTGDSGVDIILEMLANVNLNKDIQLIAVKGRIMVIGCKGDIKINPKIIMQKEGSIIGVVVGASKDSDWVEAGRVITGAIDSGSVKPVIDTEYPLDKAYKAHQDIMDSKGAKGKIVIITHNT